MLRAAYIIFTASYDLEGDVLFPSMLNDTWSAPTIYFFYIIFADLLPITSQLVSMLVVNTNMSETHSQMLGSKSEITDENLSIYWAERESIVPVKLQASTRNSTPPSLGQYMNQTPLLGDNRDNE